MHLDSRSLIKASRAAGDLVVNIRHEFLSADAPFFLPGSHGAAIHAIALPAGGEPVITKNHTNSFRDTDLKETLDAHGIEEVVILGAMVQNCVDAATRAAFDSEARTELWRLDAVQADWHGVRGGVLVGFDAARAVMLVRCGLVLGWLEEGAAWRYLLEMAADVQRSFNSWAEYAADYKLSRALWSGNATPDLFDGIADHLLVAPKSPWRQSAWQIEGLGIPRPVTPARENEPVWVLEG